MERESTALYFTKTNKKKGQFFSAHYDQSDSLTIKDPNSKRGKRRLNSFQTLLIALSSREEGGVEGGETRLFPEGRYDDSAIDVELPRGWGLVFDHRLLHAGFIFIFIYYCYCYYYHCD